MMRFSVKKPRSFKRRTVIRWTLSYLFAILIPLLAVLVFSLIMLSLNSSSITYSNQIAVSYVQGSFDNIFETVNGIKAEILVDSDFEGIRTATDFPSATSLELYQRSMDIRHMEQSSTYIESVVLYSAMLNWYMTGTSWGRISDLSGAYASELENALAPLLSSPSWDVRINDISDSEILIQVPLYFAPSLNPNCMSVGVVVRKTSILPQMLDSYHDVVLYNDRSGDVVYDFSGRFDAGSIVPLVGEIQLGESRSDGSFIASASSNTMLGLKCVVLMDRSTYFHNYYMTLRFVVAILVGSLALGIILTISRVRHEWRGYSTAAEQSGVSLENVPSEASTYTPFVSSVTGLRAEQEKMSAVISKQNATLVQNAVLRLLDGDSTVSAEYLSALGVGLVSENFYVAIAGEGNSEASADGKSSGAPSAGGLSSGVDVASYLSGLEGDGLVIAFESAYGSAFLVNTVHSDEESFCTFFRHIEQDGILDSFSISSLHPGLDGIRDAYLEVINVHEYQKYNNIAYLSYSGLIASARQNTYQFTLEENLILQKSIKEGDAERARELVYKVVDRNRSNGVFPKTLRMLLFAISGSIIRTVNGLDDRFSEAVGELNFPPILQSENFQKSLDGVIEVIDSTCYCVSAIQAQYSDSTAETYLIYRKAMDHIHSNYGNTMMNVSSIADSFGISIAYLSRIFKKYHGMNISEYITVFRLDRAKELLADGRMVGDVVDLCGFGSLRTFLRVFKSVEGITPGQYRSTVNKED